MSEILRAHRCVRDHAGPLLSHASVLTPAEPTRNTGLIFNCLRPESWCCAYVGEKGFKGWSSRASINTTCCAIDDLKFTAQDPIVYATATPPIKLSVLPSSSAAPTSTFLSSISLVSTVTSELDIDSLPTSDSEGASAGDADSNAQDQQASTGLSSGAKIGLGVGISLGVLALAALAVFFLLQRRRRRTTAASASAAAVEKDGPHLLPSSASVKGSAPPYQETQMGGTARYRYEAPSVVPVAELPASGEMAELPNPNLHQERK